MKDRFKFRAWNLEKGIMHYNAEDTYDGISENGIEHSNFSAVLEDNEYVVMQSTGLKDKNGKLIYEGDIVKVSGYGVEGIFKMFWEDVTAQFAISIYESDCFEHSQSVMEVIGNIYENKELLEAE